MSKLKKIIGIILALWFASSIPVGLYLMSLDRCLDGIALINMLTPFGIIVSDYDYRNKDLW